MRREVGRGGWRKGERGERGGEEGGEERKMNREEGREECGKGGRKGREEGRETGSIISQVLHCSSSSSPLTHTRLSPSTNTLWSHQTRLLSVP